LMIGSDKFTKWEGVRLANVNDGALLDDDRIADEFSYGRAVSMKGVC